MEILEIRATPVNIPLVAPYRATSGVVAGMTKTILEVVTDEGVVGLGEAADGDVSVVVAELAERLRGADPLDLCDCEMRCVPPQTVNLWSNTVALRRTFGAIEMALWDIRGQVEGRPLYALLGGACRREIAFTEYFSYRLDRNGEGGESTPTEVARYCAEMIERYDAPWFEGKVGLEPLEDDLDLVREVRAAIGEGTLLRLDANGGWTHETARQALRRLEPLDIRSIEDPVLTMEGMAALRRHSAIPFSTHLADLPRSVTLGAPETFVSNLRELGGIRRTIEFAAACAIMGRGFWFHSGDAAIATAAYLHVVAATESIREPSQSLLHWQTDDVVEQGPFCPRRGVVAVPQEPGLGVTLDASALARGRERYRNEGAFPGAGSSVSNSMRHGRVPAW